MPICIDIFAGPGGLGEGFYQAGFEIGVSIEKQKNECKTLLSRKIYHKLKELDELNLAESLRCGDISLENFKTNHPKIYRECEKRVLNLELGKANFKDVFQMINNAIGKPNSEELVVIGGPPCQAYSIIGRARQASKKTKANSPEKVEKFYSDERHTLYREYLKILAVYKPAVFVMENVKGILTARKGVGGKKGEVIEQILADIKNPLKSLNSDKDFVDSIKKLGLNLSEYEYNIFPLVQQSERQANLSTIIDPEPKEFLIKSEDYGVPQSRHRVIICGFRKDLLDRIGPIGCLEPSNFPTTLSDMIKSMPELISRITNNNGQKDNWRKVVSDEITKLTGNSKPNLTTSTSYETVFNNPKSGFSNPCIDFVFDVEKVFDHKTRSHMKSDLARYFYCSQFVNLNSRNPKIDDWPIGDLLPNHADIKIEGNRPKASGFSDRFKVQIWDRPANTITSHISKDGHYFIHPDPSQCRSLSIREAARIQTFPDSYRFEGGISQKFHQIGNAVPPYLAFQIGNIIKDFLKG